MLASMDHRSQLRPTRHLLCGLFSLLALLAFAESAGAKAPEVTGVRIGVNPDPKHLPRNTTRVVLDVSDATPYAAFLLGNPYRLVIDLPEVGWAVNGAASSEPKGVVERLRYGLFRAGNSRVVVDLAAPVRIAAHKPLTGPDRLMFDLVPISTNAFESGEILSATNWRPPSGGESRAPAVKPEAERTKRVVVIDAGHGGVDPGAVRGSIYEKHITAAVADEVRRRLEASGRYHVVLTRNRDVFLELRERIEVAHTNEADIFISLHADTHPKTATRGASVYTLSETASDKEAAALAAKENRVDVIAGVDLTGHSMAVANFLIELRQRQTMNESAVFANMLIDRFEGNGVRMLSGKHRFAGFAVLKSPDVPSVLVELGYLSNRYDRQELRSPKFRRNVASAILSAVDEYFRRKDALSSSG